MGDSDVYTVHHMVWVRVLISGVAGVNHMFKILFIQQI